MYRKYNTEEDRICERLMETDNGRKAITRAYARMEYYRRRAYRLAKQAKYDKEKRDKRDEH